MHLCGQAHTLERCIILASIPSPSKISIHFCFWSYVQIAVVLGQKRTAHVRARTICDLFILTKEDFHEALQNFPNIVRDMVAQANSTMDANASNSPRASEGKEDEVAVLAMGIDSKIGTDGKIDLSKCTYDELQQLEVEAVTVQVRAPIPIFQPEPF